MKMENNIIIDDLSSTATNEEINAVLEYIEKEFKTNDGTNGQFENCIRLSNFLKNNNIIIGELEAEKLLNESMNLITMFNDLSLSSIWAQISNYSNLSALLEAYSIRYNVDMIKDTELSLYTKDSGQDIDLVKLYLKEIGQYRLLTAEEEKTLATKAKHGDEDARNKLIEHNLRLVVSIAKMYKGAGLQLQDLIQFGNEGLMRASHRYDVDKGYRFSTYATWWIKQSITRGLADHGRTIRIPVHMHEITLRVKKAIAVYSAETYGETPTTKQLSEILNMPEEKIELARQCMETTISLSTPVGTDENGDTLGDMIEDQNASFENDLNYIYLKELVAELLNTPSLSEKEKEVIKYRFGFYGEILTLEQVGKIYGVTRERVRQIEARALRKIKFMAERKNTLRILNGDIPSVDYSRTYRR